MYIGSFFNVWCSNALFEFLFVMLNQKLDSRFLESFIYNKNWCFFRFYKFYFPQWSFSMKAITENQLQEILFTQFHIIRNYNQGISSDKIWAQEGKCFLQKVFLFPSSSSVIMNLFLTNWANFAYWSSSPKNIKSLILEAAKVLKLILFSVRSLKSLSPTFSQIFSVTPDFFQNFENRY